MNRRKFTVLALPALVAGLGAQSAALAAGLQDFTAAEAARALRDALELGVRKAVGQLGRANGFLGNERLRIPLPPKLRDAEGMLRRFGQGDRLDELVTSMNRAAEDAVPYATELMLGAVRAMTVEDARKILGGGDTAVTQYFAEKTRTPLNARFLPVVGRSMERIGVAGHYNQIAGPAADYGLISRDDARIEQYVTGKALDGLYLVIGEEERQIRRDPVGTGSALLGKVFGALR